MRPGNMSWWSGMTLVRRLFLMPAAKPSVPVMTRLIWALAGLLGLQLAGQLGRSRGRIGDVGHDLGMGGLEVLHHLLGELKVARHVEDVYLHRRGRNLQGGSGARGRRSSRGGRGGRRATRRCNHSHGEEYPQPLGPRTFSHLKVLLLSISPRLPLSTRALLPALRASQIGRRS